MIAIIGAIEWTGKTESTAPLSEAELRTRIWRPATVIPGMGLGALFLLAFANGLADLHALRPALVTDAGLAVRV